MNSDDILLASRAIPSVHRPALSSMALPPFLDEVTRSVPLSRELKEAIARSAPMKSSEVPLEMTWQEQASMLQRLNLNKAKGERLGPAVNNGDGTYSFAILDKQGTPIGGVSVFQEDGQLRGKFAREMGGIDGKVEAVAPNISGG
jgi:hypothetical protein